MPSCSPRPDADHIPSRVLKKSASVVLASLRGSTYRSVRLASSLAAALLDSLFEHPHGLTLSEYAGLAMPMMAGPVTDSIVMLLKAYAHRGVLLACVVLVDLASYTTLALGASGTKWMSQLAEKIMTRLWGCCRLHLRYNSC